jgi:hypothetical protein
MIRWLYGTVEFCPKIITLLSMRSEDALVAYLTTCAQYRGNLPGCQIQPRQARVLSG